MKNLIMINNDIIFLNKVRRVYFETIDDRFFYSETFIVFEFENGDKKRMSAAKSDFEKLKTLLKGDAICF